MVYLAYSCNLIVYTPCVHFNKSNFSMSCNESAVPAHRQLGVRQDNEVYTVVLKCFMQIITIQWCLFA